jgi:uncharacterized protein YjbJ (UPF0337 family)
MDLNLIEGNWNQLKVRIKDEWGQLTDDDLDKIAGKREQLASRLAELYGISEAMAEEEIDDWMVAEEYRPKSLGS